MPFSGNIDMVRSMVGGIRLWETTRGVGGIRREYVIALRTSIVDCPTSLEDEGYRSITDRAREVADEVV